MQRTDLFNALPKSLHFDRGTDEPKPEVATSRFRQLLLSISGFYSKESQLLRGISCPPILSGLLRHQMLPLHPTPELG